MANIVIKRKISLGFLGDEYKEGYLEFRAIPVKRYKEYREKIKTDDDDQAFDNIIDVLRDHFVSGKFPNDGKLEGVTKEDLDDFDAETLIKSFELLVGNADPKVPENS